MAEGSTGPTVLPTVLALVTLAGAVRVASLPLLKRAQDAVRRAASAARDGGGPPELLPAAAAGDLVVGLGGATALALTLYFARNSMPGLDLLAQPMLVPDVTGLSAETDLSLDAARSWFLGVAVLLQVLWLVLWVRTQRTLLHVGAPGEPGTPPPVGFRLTARCVLRLALTLFTPVGLLLAALVFQTVALLTSRQYRPGTAPAAGAVPPERPAAPVPTASVPTASSAPAAPAAPQPAATYVPTQADRGGGAATPPPPMPPAAPGVPPEVVHQELYPNEPRTIGGYRLLGRIGSGGMGTVYLARREGSATQVALKTIHPELLDRAELLRRFEREAEVLSMVPGAYTARVLDSGVDCGRPYLAMELLDGRPLDVHLRELGPIRSPEALRALALALGVALDGVHRLGLVHRDLKPANIMLTTAGPRLLDFGIAAIVDGTRLTRTGGGPGTLTYMAPEQFGDEQAGTAADVWAWACCVVCAAHGASPFAATSTGAVIRRIVETRPEPAALAAVRALDPALAAVVGRALTADPADRPADGAALVDLLTPPRDPRHPVTVPDQITRGWRTLTL
ncbi:serine/threonine-protein kinase [Streptomyces sp. WAC06614]|uniref:serine/threonine-protein kinase n=1 Tax=Streptomyces sp. WAC06614 TaxID=2487416 RepID=UPI000F78F65D|nr:serine/threonine-protein kinase [Streptomyces sp. WAC06614]RSS82980.1 serine/threonine protein kinase [Streptomyces sp. WAC06614]